jgi:hypothetical protein
LRASLWFSPHPPQRSAFTRWVMRVLVMVTQAIGMAAMGTVTGGYGVGVGVGALATGALIGGAIASQNQGYYYGDQNYAGYSDPGYVYSNAGPVAYNNGGTVAYCEQTYRSYDPASGSYLGYDGVRHPCP